MSEEVDVKYDSDHDPDGFEAIGANIPRKAMRSIRQQRSAMLKNPDKLREWLAMEAVTQAMVAAWRARNEVDIDKAKSASDNFLKLSSALLAPAKGKK